MENISKEDNLKRLEYFFKEDAYIKKLLYNLAPNEENFTTNQAFIVYQDKLYQGLRNIRDSLLITNKLFNLYIEDYINLIFENISNELTEKSNNYQDFKKFYEQRFSNMNPELVDKIHDNFKGYFLERNIMSILPECNTINELLHIVHSYIINCDFFYKNMPIIENFHDDYYNKTLYGNKEEKSEIMSMANELYQNLLNDKISSIIDIVPISKQNKIIMMIRDRGHALTIEADVEGDKTIIHYSIPKICNYEMVCNLKGINKIAKDDTTATGMFIIPTEQFAQEISNFISNVPSDADYINSTLNL